MTAARRLILQNSLGQNVRSILLQSDQAFLIYRADARRVEVQSDLSALDEQEISYEILKTISISELKNGSVALKGLGRLHLAAPGETLTSPSYELAEEQDQKRLPLLMKKTAVGHLIGVIFLVALSYGLKALQEKPEEQQLVTIVVPEKTVEQKVEKVQVSQTKIEKTIQKHAKVTNRTIHRPVTHKVAQKVKTQPIRKPQPVVRNAPQKSLDRIGALAALGGIKTGARDAEGLDAKSMKNIRSAGVGAGGGGVGGAGQGGIKGMMAGNGLIAGSSGNGGRAESAGGYGTKGVGGGRAGYGKISLIGGTSGVDFPAEEAEVQGGLDIEQIKAVINRNKGQITYCYEQGLQAQSNLKGRISVQFVISKAGRITVANVAQSSLQSKAVENCLIGKMKSWQFPQPVGGVNVDVLYPIDLYRVSSR